MSPGDERRERHCTDGTAFLAALRLGDSFLPVGSHTASYGLEQYLQEDGVADATELTELLRAYLHRVIGPCETVAVAAAYEGTADGTPERVLAADRRLHAVTLPREFRESSTAAGQHLLDLLAETDGLAPTATALADAVDAGETPGHYPAVLGAVAPGLGLSRDAACLLHGYGFLTDMLGAAQRLGRFGHTEIQTVLVECLADVAELPTYAERDLEEMGSFAPLVEVAGMRHARAERRLFVS